MAAALSNTEENRFWIQIFGDQADIVAFSLEPEQTADISRSKQFAARFYEMYDQACQNLSEEQLSRLNKDAGQLTQQFKQYILDVLQRQLFEKLFINLLPVFLNNIINMANMYLYILGEFLKKKQPNFEATHFLGFWLPVLTPHIAQVENNVGIYFHEYKGRASDFTAAFEQDFMRISVNLQIMQNGIPDFPINRQVISEVYSRLYSYAEFHLNTMILVEQKKIPTSLRRIYLDHFYRMLCYVVAELSFILKKDRPICDPGYLRLSLFKQYTIE